MVPQLGLTYATETVPRPIGSATSSHSRPAARFHLNGVCFLTTEVALAKSIRTKQAGDEDETSSGRNNIVVTISAAGSINAAYETPADCRAFSTWAGDSANGQVQAQ
jgi:hypothetical protein